MRFLMNYDVFADGKIGGVLEKYKKQPVVYGKVIQWRE
jgi:hypothetical protein